MGHGNRHGLGFAGQEVSPKQRHLGSAKAYVSKIHMESNEKRNMKLSCGFYICRHRQRYWNINTLVYISMNHITYIDIKIFKVEKGMHLQLRRGMFSYDDFRS